MWKTFAILAVLGLAVCACGGVGGAAYLYLAEPKDAPVTAAVDGAEEATVDAADMEEAASTKLAFAEGRAAYEAERYDDALKAFDSVLQLTPKDADALSWRGRTYGRLERFDRAEADLRDASERLPQDLETWRALGWVRDRKGDDTGALAAWDHALTLAADDPKLRLARANTNFKLGRRLPAVDDATAACSLGLQEGCTLRDRLHGLR